MSKMYCSGCGEDVETFKMLQVHYKPPVEETCCVNCGMTIDASEEEKDMSTGTILIAEDSPMLLEMLKDIVESRKLAGNVITCANGGKMIKAATEMAIAKEPFKLMLLDVSMPVLSGINAAIAFRSVENAFKISRAPIVFFTGHKCDDNFKKILQFCKPAYYVNKGAVSRPDQLADRITKVIHRVVEMKEKMEGRKT